MQTLKTRSNRSSATRSFYQIAASHGSNSPARSGPLFPRSLLPTRARGADELPSSVDVVPRSQHATGDDSVNRINPHRVREHFALLSQLSTLLTAAEVNDYGVGN